MYDGDLLWGVRASFVRYVEMMGSVEVVMPASRDAAGRLRFPLAERFGNQLRYSGEVAFRAHHGALSLTLKDPWIEVGEDDEAVLTVLDVTALEPHGTRVLLATVSSSGAAVLAEPGVALFDFQYPAGADLDPISFAQV